MALLGFTAIGRTPLGRLPIVSGNGQGVLVGVAGIGVARGVVAEVDKGITQAVGVGVAGVITANPAAILIGASGVGVAGNITLRYVNFFGAAGVGVAGSLVASVSAFPIGVKGTGVSGVLFGSEQAFLLRVSGSGVAGALSGLDQALLQGASCTGIAGLLTFPTVGGQPTQAFGVGVAGIVTVMISGGGGSAASAGDGDRPRRRHRTGLEPIAKVPQAPPAPPKPIALPPEWLSRPGSPSLVPAQDPLEKVDDGFAQLMPGIAAQIADAQDVTDIGRYLQDHDYDEQDMADIAEVLAMLD